MNLVELLYESVNVHGDRECIRFKQDGVYQSLTYQAFWDSVMRLAGGLAHTGVRFGDKVAILSNNCPQWAMSDFAVLALGAVVVPIYPSIPAEQVSYVLNNADVTTAIVENAEQLEKVTALWPNKLQNAIVMSPLHTNFDVLSATHPVFHLSDVMAFEPPADFSTLPFQQIPESQLATIVHTSGTSGNPKGVMLSHRNIVSNVQASLSMLPVQPGDISLSYLPLSHIFERTVGQFAALAAGSTIAYAERIETIPVNLLEVRPTILITVPRLLEKVYTQVMAKLEQLPKPLRNRISAGLAGQKDTGFIYRLVDTLVYRKLREGLGGRMRLVISGGAALAVNIAEFYAKAGIPVHEGYGMTEASPVMTVNPLGENRPGMVGKVIPGAEVRIADDGEFLFKGPNVMMGYYGAPDETAKALDGDWLHTGDIAEVCDGYVKIVDRKKNIMVLATGKNVAPGPVESAIGLSPYLSSAVLIGDGRTYVTCLLAPDVASLRPIAKRLHLGDDVADWVAHPEVRNLVATEVRRLTQAFAPFERPKRGILLPHELTLEAGDLTPTLKVKTRILMAKYGVQIEGMYNGLDYLPILENRATPKRRHIRWMVAVGMVVLLFGVGGAFAAGARLPKKLDVLGMVRHIYGNNDKINQENGKIVGTLQDINHLAATTSTIGSNLHTLKDGIVQDGGSLNNLNQLSQQEIDLSQNFYSLGQTLQTDLTAINNAATTENNSVAAMVRQANQLNQVAHNLAQVNQVVASKLAAADGKTRTIAAEMP